MTKTSIQSRLGRTLFALCLAAAVPLAQAAPTTYSVTFDATTGSDGKGSFVWDANSKTMTQFSWAFPDGAGSFSDAGLAKSDYTGSARSVGELLFNLFTDPKAFWPSTLGLTSVSKGFFTTGFFGASQPVSGTIPADMFVVGYTKNTDYATFEMLDLSPSRTVQTSGTIFAAPVPEPESAAMLLAGLALLAPIAARRRKIGR